MPAGDAEAGANTDRLESTNHPTDPKPPSITVFIGTWNLHACTPTDDLALFIPKESFDVYAIGTEECGQSLEVSLVYDDKTKWVRKLVHHLGDKWVAVQSVTLNAIHLAIFIRRELYQCVSNISSSSVATGVGNVIGNKGICGVHHQYNGLITTNISGGVAISFTLGNLSFVFINCHFHAHDNGVSQRNADFHTIDSGLSLSGSNGRRASEAFDIVFWFGDLNYRINGGRRMVDSLIKSQMLEVMKANEQLTMEMRKGNIFSGFTEGDITFPPSYKFDKNSDVYDSSKKQRVPSWTDRILWKESTHIVQLKYASVNEVKTSDHRPVIATFMITSDWSTARANNPNMPSQGSCILQ